jgi:hypothetical protein
MSFELEDGRECGMRNVEWGMNWPEKLKEEFCVLSSEF